MFEKFIGWIVGRIADRLYGGLSFDLDEEDFV